MSNKKTICSFNCYEYHKGFYNDDDPTDSLSNIKYADFFEVPDDDEFPYFSAYLLLCGSCDLFALSLQKLLKYNVYIIEGNNKKGFHAFCKVYRNNKWYYVDARWVTSSFDEFMEVAKMFVNDEYTIRPVSDDDIRKWETYGDYRKEGCEFAEAVIKKFKECYTL